MNVYLIFLNNMILLCGVCMITERYKKIVNKITFKIF